MKTVSLELQRRIEAGELFEDSAQLRAAAALDDLLKRLNQDEKKSFLFWKDQETPKGLYLWGGVGKMSLNQLDKALMPIASPTLSETLVACIRNLQL